MPRVKTTPKVAVKKRPYMNTYDEKSMEQAVRAVKEKLKSMRYFVGQLFTFYKVIAFLPHFGESFLPQ